MSWHKAESVALSPWANYPSQSAPLKNQIKPTCKTFNIKPGTYGYLITHYWMFLCYTNLGLKLHLN